jgi:hypothetical protein
MAQWRLRPKYRPERSIAVDRLSSGKRPAYSVSRSSRPSASMSCRRAGTPTTCPSFSAIAPACAECNDDFKDLEEEFLLNIGFALDGTDPDFRDVYERMHRSWRFDPSLPAAEFEKRNSKLSSIANRLVYVDFQPGKPFVWASRPGEKIPRPSSPAMVMESKVRHIIGEKLARGLHWIETGETFPKPLPFHAMLVGAPETLPPELLTFLPAFNAIEINERLAPVLAYRFVHSGVHRVWWFRIWKKVELLVFAEEQQAEATTVERLGPEQKSPSGT